MVVERDEQAQRNEHPTEAGQPAPNGYAREIAGHEPNRDADDGAAEQEAGVHTEQQGKEKDSGSKSSKVTATSDSRRARMLSTSRVTSPAAPSRR